jgi:creatinine amidohydrolase/Fe(II)-dependent formamide hydrolase-like protein
MVCLLMSAGIGARSAQAQSPEASLAEEMATPRTIDALNSVWLEELTWLEVRDLLREGTTTAIVATGGIEQNGPWLALGKHNYVLQLACEEMARALGDALCAPIIKLVPEGGFDPPSGHMRYPGTLSLSAETFEAVLTDVARSLATHGFETIVFIGDSGGNQRGMAAVAERLNDEWGASRVLYVPEFYRYAEVFTFMKEELGIVEPQSDGIHDDFVISSILMGLDPMLVRHPQRLATGQATINGLSLEPVDEVVEIGRRLLEFRVEMTVDAIRAARSPDASGADASNPEASNPEAPGPDTRD